MSEINNQVCSALLYWQDLVSTDMWDDRAVDVAVASLACGNVPDLVSRRTGDASTPHPRFGPVDADQAAPTSLRYQIAAAAARTGRNLMRFYFDISDRLAIRDEVGRDFTLTSDAVLHAKYLAADLRCLERDVRPQLSIQIMSESREHIHAEAVFA